MDSELTMTTWEQFLVCKSSMKMSAWFSVAAKQAHQVSEIIKKEIENKTENSPEVYRISLNTKYSSSSLSSKGALKYISEEGSGNNQEHRAKVRDN